MNQAAATAESLYRTRVLQNPSEHAAFLELLKKENVKSYLEIGSMYGGSLWRTAHVLPKGAKVVSVDYASHTPEALPHLKEAVAALKSEGYDVHLLHGDSTSPEIVEKVSDLAPFDCVFIDGSHTFEDVQADWENYGPMGRIVAFHDIAWNSTWKSSVPGRVTMPIYVPEVWDRVKKEYRHKELKLHPAGNYYGIGILWRA